MKKTLFSGVLSLMIGIGASAQPDTTGTSGKIGNMTVAAFNSINAKGNQMVQAIKATSAPLSAADQQLLTRIATGGQRQLAVSQALLNTVTNPQVKLLAASEVEEQTGIAAKLKEIADAKGVTLPDGPDATTQQLVTQAQSLTGTEADAFYLDQGGIKGHELLQQTMTTVNNTAKDENLKKLAVGTLPVIRTHLSVSKAVKATKKTGAGATMR